MAIDNAKCPHCGTRISGDEIEIMEVDTGGQTVPIMGTNKDPDESVYVCPSCNVILA